jgi:hypothetical protein
VKRFVGWARGRVRSGTQPDATSEPGVTADPTPIRISKRARTVLILAVLVLLGLVVWYVPSVLTTVIGGFALALALSFPVRLFSRLMPRGLAVLLSFLILVGLVVLATLYLVPLAGRLGLYALLRSCAYRPLMPMPRRSETSKGRMGEVSRDASRGGGTHDSGCPILHSSGHSVGRLRSNRTAARRRSSVTAMEAVAVMAPCPTHAFNTT